MQIHLSRNGQLLGVFDLDAIRYGLQNGTYQFTDLGWHEGAAGWLPLSQMPQFTPPAAPPTPPVMTSVSPAPPAPPAFTPPPLSAPPYQAPSAPPAYQPPQPYTPPGQYAPNPYQPGAPNPYAPPGNFPAPARRGGSKAVWIVLGLLVLGGLGAYGYSRYALFKTIRSDHGYSGSSTPDPRNGPENSNATLAARRPQDFLPKKPGEFSIFNENALVVHRRDFDPSRTTHFHAFTLNYPTSWSCKTGSQTKGNQFASLEYAAVKGALESVSVNHFFATNGTSAYKAQQELGPQLMAQSFAQLARSIPGLRKTSEGWAKLGEYNVYQMCCIGRDDHNDDVYLRLATISPDDTDPEGLSITLVAGARTAGVKRPEDLGESGEMFVIANTFRFINE